MHKRNWMLAALLLMSGSVLAGPEIPKAHFNVDVWEASGSKIGLPENVVTTLAQTRDGYLWVGTLDGLARFDGVQFDKFSEANTPGLNSVQIAHFFEDGESNLWIGTTMAGVALVKNGTVQTVLIGAGSREGKLVSACEDTNRTVWLFTADRQLARRRKDSKNIDVWRGVPPNYFGRYRNYRTLIAEKSGAVWVGTDSGLWRVDTSTQLESTNIPDGQEAVPAPGGLDYALASRNGGYWRLAAGLIEKWHGTNADGHPIAYPWIHGYPISACEDNDGNLVVGTQDNGVWWFNSKGGAEHLSGADGLTHDTILSLCVDGEGSLWVGTDGGGLNRVRRSHFGVLGGTEGKTVQSVSEGSAGDLWVGFNGGGVMHWKDATPEQYGDNAPYAYVRAVLMGSDQQGLRWAQVGAWNYLPPGGCSRF